MLTFNGLRNESGLKFVDISSELWREYDFGNDRKITIKFPQALNVAPSGGHRILDGQGISHYIPKGWIHLSWEAKEGQPHFVK